MKSDEESNRLPHIYDYLLSTAVTPGGQCSNKGKLALVAHARGRYSHQFFSAHSSFQLSAHMGHTADCQIDKTSTAAH